MEMLARAEALPTVVVPASLNNPHKLVQKTKADLTDQEPDRDGIVTSRKYKEDRRLNEAAAREGNAMIGIYPTGVGEPLVVLMEAIYRGTTALGGVEERIRNCNPRWRGRAFICASYDRKAFVAGHCG
jgi:hypothetical protein